MINESQVRAYDYTLVNIPIILSASVDDLQTFGYGPGTTDRATILNLEAPANQIAAGQPLDYADVTMLTNWTDSNTQGTDVYQEAKQRFIDRTFFIWGDINQGGLFIYKNDNIPNCIHFGCVYGYYKMIINGVTMWHYLISLHTYSAQGYLPQALSETLIGFTEDSRVDTPSFRILTVDQNAGVEITDNLYSRTASFTQLIFDGYGAPVAEASLESATNDISVYEVPVIGWDVCPNKIWGHCIEQVWYMSYAPEGDLVYGQWCDKSKVNKNLNPGENGGLSINVEVPGAFPNDSRNGHLSDPGASGIDAASSGFITLYNPDRDQIKRFNNFLFSASITDAIANALKKLVADPLDYLVFIAMVRFTPPTPDAQLHPISFVGFPTGVSARIVEPQSFYFDYGPVKIEPAFSGFQDHNPYSSATIHLPYIGFKEINIDEIQDSEITVRFIIDCMTGTCVAQIFVHRDIRPYMPTPRGDTAIDDCLYEFSGNCFEMLPLSATDFRSLFGSVLQAAVGVGTSLAAGNLSGAVASALSGVSSSKINVEHSGNLSASAGYFGQQDVYLRLERPIQSLPVDYPRLQGMPSNFNIRTISELKGLGWCEFEPETLILDELVNATKEEIEEIRSILSKGMIF